MLLEVLSLIRISSLLTTQLNVGGEWLIYFLCPDPICVIIKVCSIIECRLD